ncbi:hypothetical protein [Paraclostridium bifermentans]|uniref:hypothetical protein n=1 Tax=Paraclostridium bifermentans TaxID=1490 RepID=UPI00359C67E6
MYLPNKITNVLCKIDRPYEIKYENGKITYIYIKDKDVKIEASSKGFCLNMKGGPIFLNDLKSLEPLLVKVGAIEKRPKSKKEKLKRDNLIELFSKKRNTFSVEYINSKVLSIKMENSGLVIKKTGVGYAMIVNNESISIDNVSSLKKLLIKMNIIEDDKKVNKSSEDGILFEQLTLNLDEL